MINLKELKSRLNNMIEDKNSEAAMASVISINCKVPQELSGFLTDILGLTSTEEEALDVLYNLDPKQVVILATLAMIANGRLSDFIAMERNMYALKASVTRFLAENNEYRNTSVDETNGSLDSMFMAITKMKEVLSSANKDRK
jgi:hypothetical protein